MTEATRDVKDTLVYRIEQNREQSQHPSSWTVDDYLLQFEVSYFLLSGGSAMNSPNFFWNSSAYDTHGDYRVARVAQLNSRSTTCCQKYDISFPNMDNFIAVDILFTARYARENRIRPAMSSTARVRAWIQLLVVLIVQFEGTCFSGLPVMRAEIAIYLVTVFVSYLDQKSLLIDEITWNKQKQNTADISIRELSKTWAVSFQSCGRFVTSSAKSKRFLWPATNQCDHFWCFCRYLRDILPSRQSLIATAPCSTGSVNGLNTQIHVGINAVHHQMYPSIIGEALRVGLMKSINIRQIAEI